MGVFILTATSLSLIFYKAGRRKMFFLSNFTVDFKVTSSSLPPHHFDNMLDCNDLFLISAFLVNHSKGHLLFIILSSVHLPMPGHSVKSLMNKQIAGLSTSTTTGRYKW